MRLDAALPRSPLHPPKEGVMSRTTKADIQGFSLIELLLVVAGGVILLGSAVPALNTMLDQYRIRMTAESIVSQLQFARMKSVSSNEPFRVNFPAAQRVFQVETSGGNLVAGPFSLARGVVWNSTDSGDEVTFPGRYVTFLPTGNVALSGNGSAGRAKLIGRTGVRIDIVVSTGGVIRQTQPYDNPPAPF
jgi:hypothetical protein